MSEFLTYLPGILLAYSVLIVGMLSPGPNILAILGTSMSVGRPQGMSLAFGTAIGSALWAILTMIGITAIVTAYPLILIGIKIFGGLFLLWLAFKSFKSSLNKHDIETSALEGHLPLWRYGLRGFLVQMTNPKAAIFWVATISLAIKADTPYWIAMLFVFGAFLISFIGHQIYAIAFSTKVMITAYAKARRPIQFVLGSLFTAAGLRLLLFRTT